MSSNLLYFPKDRCRTGLDRQERVQISLQMSDGSELHGELVLKRGQAPQSLLQDSQGFIPLERPDGIVHIVSTALVDGIRVLSTEGSPFPAA